LFDVRGNNTTIPWKSLVASVALLTNLFGTAYALPSYSSNCTGCHTRPAGAFSILPSNLLQLPMGETRGININVTSTGGGNSALSLTGLNAGLSATADASWTNQGTWWTLGPFSGTGSKSLNLTPGAGAVRGSYPISVTLAGGDEDWSTTGSFTVKIGVPGDYNDNGVVDAADYVLWRKGGPLQFEIDTPGTVNAADYTAWRARFGKTTAGAGSALIAINSAPEPATVFVVVVGMLAMTLFVRVRY
jgi:hypothetical protein